MNKPKPIQLTRKEALALSTLLTQLTGGIQTAEVVCAPNLSSTLNDVFLGWRGIAKKIETSIGLEYMNRHRTRGIDITINAYEMAKQSDDVADAHDGCGSEED